MKLPVDVLFNFTESEENMDKIHEVENLKDQIDDMIQDISNNLHKKSHEDSIKSLNDLQNLINNYVNLLDDLKNTAFETSKLYDNNRNTLQAKTWKNQLQLNTNVDNTIKDAIRSQVDQNNVVDNKVDQLQAQNQLISNVRDKIVKLLAKRVALLSKNRPTVRTDNKIAKLQHELVQLEFNFWENVQENPNLKYQQQSADITQQLNQLHDQQSNGSINKDVATRMRLKLETQLEDLNKRMVRMKVPLIDPVDRTRRVIMDLRNAISDPANPNPDATRLRMNDVIDQQATLTKRVIAENNRGLDNAKRETSELEQSGAITSEVAKNRYALIKRMGLENEGEMIKADLEKIKQQSPGELSVAAATEVQRLAAEYAKVAANIGRIKAEDQPDYAAMRKSLAAVAPISPGLYDPLKKPGSPIGAPRIMQPPAVTVEPDVSAPVESAAEKQQREAQERAEYERRWKAEQEEATRVGQLGRGRGGAGARLGAAPTTGVPLSERTRTLADVTPVLDPSQQAQKEMMERHHQENMRNNARIGQDVGQDQERAAYMHRTAN